MSKSTLNEQKKVYKEIIEPIITELKLQCKRRGMPCFVTVCLYPGDEPDTEEVNGDAKPIRNNPCYESVYAHDFQSPNSVGVRMNPDYIAECVKIVNGFHAVNNGEETFNVDSLMIPDEEYFNIPEDN